LIERDRDSLKTDISEGNIYTKEYAKAKRIKLGNQSLKIEIRKWGYAIDDVYREEEKGETLENCKNFIHVMSKFGSTTELLNTPLCNKSPDPSEHVNISFFFATKI
jgi:hypothetical protein